MDTTVADRHFVGMYASFHIACIVRYNAFPIGVFGTSVHSFHGVLAYLYHSGGIPSAPGALPDFIWWRTLLTSGQTSGPLIPSKFCRMGSTFLSFQYPASLLWPVSSRASNL